MSENEQITRIRPELRCISVNDLIWGQIKSLAEKNDLSVSSYIRQVMKKQYRQHMKNLLNLSGIKNSTVAKWS